MIPKGMDDQIEKAVQEIRCRHREIINDWCKAYLAQLYEEGEEIKPGCFTLNEQHLDNVGGSIFGKRYWFEKGTPHYSRWISVEDKQPKDMFKLNEPCPEVLIKDHWGFKIGKQFQCGKWVDDHLYSLEGVTHWMPLPKPPEE